MVADVAVIPVEVTALIAGTEAKVEKVKFADVAVPAAFTETAA
jgi:hypothetical protein